MQNVGNYNSIYLKKNVVKLFEISRQKCKSSLILCAQAVAVHGAVVIPTCSFDYKASRNWRTEIGHIALE